MKTVPSIDWQEGMLLAPDHFEQTERHFASQAMALYSYVQSLNWGFACIEYDEQMLSKGGLKFLRLKGITRQGLHFDLYEMEGCSMLPPAREMTEFVKESGIKKGVIEVYLALPVQRPFGTASLKQEKGGLENQINVRFPRFQVLANPELHNLNILDRLKVAELQVLDGSIALRQEFTPACLSINLGKTRIPQNYIFQTLAEIISLMKVRARTLAENIHQSDMQDPADRALRAAYDFPVLATLNEAVVLFQHYLTLASMHPEWLYRELIRFIGRLTTFSAAEVVSEKSIAPYTHDNLEHCFAEIKTSFVRLLEGSNVIVDRVTRIPLEGRQIENQPALIGVFDGAIVHDVPSFMQGSDFYIRYQLNGSAKQRLKKELLISSPDVIAQIIAYSTRRSVEMIDREGYTLPGIKADATSAFFQLKKEGSDWQKIESSAQIAFYSSERDVLNLLEPELFAVTKSTVEI